MVRSDYNIPVLVDGEGSADVDEVLWAAIFEVGCFATGVRNGEPEGDDRKGFAELV